MSERIRPFDSADEEAWVHLNFHHSDELALLHLFVLQAIVEGPQWSTHIWPVRLNDNGRQHFRRLLAADVIRPGPAWDKFLKINPELREPEEPS